MNQWPELTSFHVQTYQNPVNFYCNMRIKLKTKFMEVLSKMDVHRLFYYPVQMIPLANLVVYEANDGSVRYQLTRVFHHLLCSLKR